MDAAVVEDADFLVDLNALLASFSDGPVLSDVVVPPPPSETGSPESVNSRPHPGAGLSEIERFLMEDADEAAAAEDGVGEGIGVEEFLDAVFAGGEEESEAGGSTDGSSGKDGEEGKVEVEVEVEAEVAGDDPIGRKQRRQMRNRDSAMKSRARKKMYVKDLEMKSKYLEAECRRLSYALQCCAAENMALRQSLLKDRPVGAPTAMMQESAVLMETLPLVSLLWLVGIVCLFLMPGLPNRSPMAPSSLGRDPALVAGKTSSDEPETLELLLHGRRSKGTRARIKLSPLPLLGIATC